MKETLPNLSTKNYKNGQKVDGKNPDRPNWFRCPLSTKPCCTTYTASLKSAQIKFITLLEQATSYNKTDKKKGSPQFQTRTRHTILEKSLNFSTLDVNVNVHI